MREVELGDKRLVNSLNADFSYTNLKGRNLRNSFLRFINLEGSDLSGADLRDADLGYANLLNANLEKSFLSFADLNDANLRGANLRGANLTGTDLENCRLDGADLSGIEGKKILTCSAGKDFAYCCDGFIKIGYSLKTIKRWTCEIDDIYSGHSYSPLDIEIYSNFINLCDKTFS